MGTERRAGGCDLVLGEREGEAETMELAGRREVGRRVGGWGPGAGVLAAAEGIFQALAAEGRGGQAWSEQQHDRSCTAAEQRSGLLPPPFCRFCLAARLPRQPCKKGCLHFLQIHGCGTNEFRGKGTVPVSGDREAAFRAVAVQADPGAHLQDAVCTVIVNKANPQTLTAVLLVRLGCEQRGKGGEGFLGSHVDCDLR